MKNTRKNKSGSDSAWENRKLGASEKYVRKVSAAREKELDEHLGLQAISIRLQKSLIDDLKKLAEEDGIGYQPYIRQLLMRHVRNLAHDRREKSKREKDVLRAR